MPQGKHSAQFSALRMCRVIKRVWHLEVTSGFDVQGPLGSGSGILSTIKAHHRHRRALFGWKEPPSPRWSLQSPHHFLPLWICSDGSACPSEQICLSPSLQIQCWFVLNAQLRGWLPPGMFSFLPVGGQHSLLWTWPWVLLCISPEVLLFVRIKIELHS